ncbi:MAG: DUF58 domain-containing protein [Paenibacillaceae bacterium]
MSVAIARIASMISLLFAAVVLAVVGGYMGLFLSGSIGFVFIYMLVISLWIRRGDILAERMLNQQRIQAGDEVEVTITISLPARYWLCWIVVEERWVQQKQCRESEMPELGELHDEQYACLAFIRGSRHIKCHYTTSAKARGLYRVHSSRVMIGDMFGLVKRVLVQEEQDAEIVRVNPVPLAGHWFKRIRLGEETPSDYGTLRDYISGDPISSIDWKSYARHQKLKTKQLEVEERKSMLIVMDGRKTHFERIVSAVTRMVLEMNDPSLELVLACGESRCSVSTRHSKQSGVSAEIYEWLTSIEALSIDSFTQQIRTALARSGSDEGRIVIGVTATSDEPIQQESSVYTYPPSIQLLYIPPNGDGELIYA